MDRLLLKVYRGQLTLLDSKHYHKMLINTLNVHCFNVAQKDKQYLKALLNSDILLPDGSGIVLAMRVLYSIKLRKIAGFDLFVYELKNLNLSSGRCFFLGSTNEVLNLIRIKLNKEYPNIHAGFYSPPFKDDFDYQDNEIMLEKINSYSPQVLFLGMTAPKQEKWANEFSKRLDVYHICCIGAVFDFYAGTVSRSPNWMIKNGLEWFYRFLKEPRRLWRRYILGNMKFIYWILQEKIKVTKQK